MPANINPIYALTPNIGRAVPLLNVKSDGTGTIATDLALALTAGANGCWVASIQFRPVATVAATATAATVLRAFLSTKASGVTVGGTDTWQIAEVAAPAQTADQTTTADTSIIIPLGFAIPATQTILVSTHIANIANTTWQALVLGGDY